MSPFDFFEGPIKVKRRRDPVTLIDWVYRFKYKTRQEARPSLFDYIEMFYNRDRSHSALQYMNPYQYELYKMAT
jgi:transposase InsO family protein